MKGRKGQGQSCCGGDREGETLKQKIKNKHLREWTFEGALE